MNQMQLFQQRTAASNPQAGPTSPLPQNNDAQLSEMSGLLKQLPNYFNTDKLSQAYGQQRDFNTSVGMQGANNASREFINRQNLTGGDTSLGGLVRAQSFLPFLQQNADSVQKEQATKLDANTQLAKLSGDVATSLGQLRTNYLGTLANYTSNMYSTNTNAALQRERMAQQGAQFGQQLGLDQQRFGLQKQQQNFQQGQSQQQLDLQRMLALDQHNRSIQQQTQRNTSISYMPDTNNPFGLTNQGDVAGW